MGAVSKGLGGPIEFHFEDKVYKLSPWTYGVQEKYETFLEGQVFRKIKRHRALLTSDEYDDLLRATTRDVAAGVYTFGSSLVAESLNSLSNMKRMILIMIQDNHPQEGLELVDRIVADEAAFKELMARMSAANSDPNATTPAVPQAG